VYFLDMASTSPRRDKQAGRLLRQWRIDRGLSPEQLSWQLALARSPVTGRQIRRIEEGGVVPTPRVQFALASFFDARPTEVWRTPLSRVAA
jgi:transcriptional regulator with XRE-family HTH domain